SPIACQTWPGHFVSRLGPLRAQIGNDWAWTKANSSSLRAQKYPVTAAAPAIGASTAKTRPGHELRVTNRSGIAMRNPVGLATAATAASSPAAHGLPRMASAAAQAAAASAITSG